MLFSVDQAILQLLSDISSITADDVTNHSPKISTIFANIQESVGETAQFQSDKVFLGFIMYFFNLLLT